MHFKSCTCCCNILGNSNFQPSTSSNVVFTNMRFLFIGSTEKFGRTLEIRSRSVCTNYKVIVRPQPRLSSSFGSQADNGHGTIAMHNENVWMHLFVYLLWRNLLLLRLSAFCCYGRPFLKTTITFLPSLMCPFDSKGGTCESQKAILASRAQ